MKENLRLKEAKGFISFPRKEQNRNEETFSLERPVAAWGLNNTRLFVTEKWKNANEESEKMVKEETTKSDQLGDKNILLMIDEYSYSRRRRWILKIKKILL